ncbi:hypothetical protein B0H14DRAFT_3725892 [Mycena olivaceomarginata]|nr:hypothetical protein B0H14DRAFT_3725892 [Mycena olivaceomarginata]
MTAERCVGFPGIVSDLLKTLSDFLKTVSFAAECVGFPDLCAGFPGCVAVSGFVYTLPNIQDPFLCEPGNEFSSPTRDAQTPVGALVTLGRAQSWFDCRNGTLFGRSSQSDSVSPEIMDSVDTVDDQIGVHSIDCFQTAPSLVNISIFNEYRFVPVLLPVHQLTRYDIDCQLEGHIRVLKQTPNIIEARIDIAFDEEAWPDSPKIVDLLRLRRLYISSAGALKYFKIPALEELALGNSGEDTPSHFLSLLDRSFSDKIDALIATLTSPMIAPHLHLIFFGCEEESHLDYMAYLEMLKSRRTAENCALKSAALIIEHGIKPDSETIHGLHGLRQQGLNLYCWRDLRLAKKLLAGTTDPYDVDFFSLFVSIYGNLNGNEW